MSKLVGEFLHDSTYSKFPSLSPELSVDVTSLSGLAVFLVFVEGPSVGRAQL